MAIKTTINIDVDFYDKKYILVNAKQLDRGSRFLLVNCFNQGKIMPITNGGYSAFVRYKKPDNHSVFNMCTIKGVGQIEIELTEQMLAVDGICYADLVIVDKGYANVNPETGEIVAIDDTAILSTMTFCIDVSETAVANSDIESSDEFDALNKLLIESQASYLGYVLACRSYTNGDTGQRENEEVDNAQYYYEQSLANAESTGENASSASDSAASALESKNSANIYKDEAKRSAEAAALYEGSAMHYSSDAAARASESAESANVSRECKDDALSSKSAAELSATQANDSASSAEVSANRAQSYAVGGTGTRDGEDTDNAMYYAEQSQTSANNANISATSASDSASAASNSEANAEAYMNSASESATSATDSASEAFNSETNAKTSETNSKTSEINAKTSEGNALASEQNSKASEVNALNSETNALSSANRAQSYAVGGTGTRDGEDINNAQWYYNEIKDIVNGLNIVFVPKGTIYFSELATAKETAVAGYIYNIKDDFVTDNSFREGSGVTYTAGTNVYYVVDENGEYKWDAFGGAASPTATVDETKDYLGI